MSVTLAEPIFVAPRTVVLSWSSDLGGEPWFYVYRNGRFLHRTKVRSGRFTARLGEPLVVDVFDVVTERPPYARSAIAELEIGALGNFTSIERDLGGGQYATEVRVLGGSTVRILSRPIAEDGETFRVRATYDDGESTPVNVPASIVRNPTPPEVTATFDGGTKQVTFAAVP